MRNELMRGCGEWDICKSCKLFQRSERIYKDFLVAVNEFNKHINETPDKFGCKLKEMEG